MIHPQFISRLIQSFLYFLGKAATVMVDFFFSMDLCPLRAGLKYHLFSPEGLVSTFLVFWGLQLIPLFFFSPKKPLKD